MTANVKIEGRGFNYFYFVLAQPYSRLRSDRERRQWLREEGLSRRGETLTLQVGRHYFFFPVCLGQPLRLTGSAAVRIRRGQTSQDLSCLR